MKFLTLFIVVLSAVMFTGCEKQFLSPIKEPIMECITEESIAGIPYEVTEILVRYDEETWMQQTFPISAVNEFLISKGYTPKVKEMDDADRTEIIVSDFDFRPVIEELTTIPGVVSVRPHNEYLDAFEYDPGVILVAYNEKTWQAAFRLWKNWLNFLKLSTCNRISFIIMRQVMNINPSRYLKRIDDFKLSQLCENTEGNISC